MQTHKEVYQTIVDRISDNNYKKFNVIISISELGKLQKCIPDTIRIQQVYGTYNEYIIRIKKPINKFILFGNKDSFYKEPLFVFFCLICDICIFLYFKNC